MTEKDVLEVARNTIMVALQLAMPVLLCGLIVGVLISLFQAVTQIQEFTLTFVPKLLAIIAALAIFGPWMLSTMVHFFTYTFNHMPPVVK